ncbi:MULTISPECIES: flagella biosynthesis regulator Flk [Brenneria]|uniref:Flagella biosynthesis regulator Flk n=1 Tax=Brenneria nigrifluens DSM 30175 = ATCC 13028 TaxID=1121120 RepID=A0A2U1UPX1_9GAMM|nr:MULTISPECIES: flagella biosynthesis regulator Flk [Brenneria]EHD20737.1 flagella biosynthesis regulator [Brenneria sp. EniD312]PWC23651.1 flagella biosynthesis regulator Flk [Brenneria nigrifluens DSM 30175 = ATCC 13028]QCR03909.1 flagella biosynthesis regulator Flk [Brenneria nigrifluens DSM 30175 = ATCC 13028]
MQPVSGPGAPLPGDRAVSPQATSPAANAPGTDGGDAPLTPAQRATLENLMVKIVALGTLKASEVWSSVKQGLGLQENAELTSRHYQPAEQQLQTRLTQTQAQDNGARQQLMQRVTELLTQGNNRQVVSDFIHQQFGHTTLSSLNKAQLQQVATLLQPGPTAPANTASTQPHSVANPPERSLSPAEQHSLNQLVTRLASQSGEQPVKIWTTLMTMQNLNAGQAIPLKNLPLLTQFLQTQASLQQLPTASSPPLPQGAPTTLAADVAPNQPAANAAQTSAGTANAASISPQTAAIATLQAALPQPLTAQEQQMLLDYMQNRFNAGWQTPLAPMQLSEALTFLFTQRIQRAQETDWTAPQPLLNPLIAALPLNWPALFQKSMFWTIAGVGVALFLLWVVF